MALLTLPEDLAMEMWERACAATVVRAVMTALGYALQVQTGRSGSMTTITCLFGDVHARISHGKTGLALPLPTVRVLFC